MSAHSNLTQTLLAARSAGAGITLSAEQLDALFSDPAILCEDDLISIEEVCQKAKISRMTLHRLRRDDLFIEAISTSARRVCFRRSDFTRWLRERTT